VGHIGRRRTETALTRGQLEVPAGAFQGSTKFQFYGIKSVLIVGAICALLGSIAVQALAAPILIPGIQEPEEMRVEPFASKKVDLTPPQRMLGDVLSGYNKPADWLPALNRLIAQYPEYPDPYILRLATLCEGNDAAAVASDLDHALKFIGTSLIDTSTAKDSIGSLLSMRAKMEYATGNYVGAMDGLDKAISADLGKAAEFTNSGAVQPEQTASICTWTEPDMNALVQRFPRDYRSYLFRGLYFSAPLHEESLKPAIENFSKAAELNPKSALPQLYKAKILGNLFVFNHRLNQLGWKDAARDKLNYELVVEYSKALSLDPNLLPALNGRALAYSHLKQFEKAITDYDKILSLDPKNIIVHDRALAKMESGRDYEAISDFNARPHAVQRLELKLSVGLYRNTARRWALHCFCNRVGVPEVVLMTLAERFGITRWYLLHVMAERNELASYTVRRHTSFNAN
jgi:tetratricopeptide (TPR) repeat protein